MAEAFILAEFHANSVRRDALARCLEAAVAALEGVDGFRSLTLWLASGNQSEFLFLSHYSDPDAAAQALEALSGGHLLSDHVESLSHPPDVRQVAVNARDGVSPGKVELGGYLSISTQTSSQEDDARPDLEDALAELLFLPGCLGTAHGLNVALPRETIGIAFWSNHDAFQEFVSTAPPYPVRAFRRIA